MGTSQSSNRENNPRTGNGNGNSIKQPVSQVELPQLDKQPGNFTGHFGVQTNPHPAQSPAQSLAQPSGVQTNKHQAQFPFTPKLGGSRKKRAKRNKSNKSNIKRKNKNKSRNVKR